MFRRLVALDSMVFTLICALISGAHTADTGDYFQHTVTKGETVSLLCIQYYGYYSEKLGQAFKELNPLVADINVIVVGQELTFRRPAAPAAATAPVANAARQEPEQLFEKRVDATQGVVTYVSGKAFLLPADGGSQQTLLANKVVYPGDVIATGSDGRVELIVNRESIIRMKENTRLTVDAFRDNGTKSGKTKVGFNTGSVWAKVRNFKDRISRFELELPTAIAGVHGTVYQGTINADATADVKVYTGEVAVKGKAPQAPAHAGGVDEISGPDEIAGPQEVSMEAWIEIVRSMQQLRIDPTGKPSKPVSFAKNPSDGWEKWNEERDRRIAEMFTEK